MTENRDFKQHVRDRAAKTGESYQAARRQLARRRGERFTARAVNAFLTPSGVALGCVIEGGEVRRGMFVTVTTVDGRQHQAKVVSLRHRGRTWMRSATAAATPSSA